MENEMWLIWKDHKSRRRYKIGLLNENKNEYTFSYANPELDDAQKVGFSCFPGFDDVTKTYHSNKLFANIETRLPNPSRPDYLEILNSYNLDSHSSNIKILKMTRGRLITDNYEFIPAFDKNKIMFDVAGTRHCPDVEKCKKLLTAGELLFFELEPENLYDEFAIKVIYLKNRKKYHLGYVPRYYSKQLTDLLNQKVNYSAMIESINFEANIGDENITTRVKLIFNI